MTFPFNQRLLILFLLLFNQADDQINQISPLLISSPFLIFLALSVLAKIPSLRDGWGSFFTPTIYTHTLLLSSFVIKAMSPRGGCLDSPTLVIPLSIARHSLLNLQHSSLCAPLATVFAPYTRKPYDLCYRFIPYCKPENLPSIERIGFLLQALDIISLILAPCYYF